MFLGHPEMNKPDPADAVPPSRRAAFDNARTGGEALEKWYLFLLWLVPTVDKLPRSQKFTLGDRLQNSALSVLDALVEASDTHQPAVQLRKANLGLERLRYLVRLTLDLRLLDPRRYEFATSAIDEVGHLLEGWLKAEGGCLVAASR